MQEREGLMQALKRNSGNAFEMSDFLHMPHHTPFTLLFVIEPIYIE